MNHRPFELFLPRLILGLLMSFPISRDIGSLHSPEPLGLLIMAGVAETPEVRLISGASERDRNDMIRFLGRRAAEFALLISSQTEAAAARP